MDTSPSEQGASKQAVREERERMTRVGGYILLAPCYGVRRCVFELKVLKVCTHFYSLLSFHTCIYHFRCFIWSINSNIHILRHITE